MTEHLPECHLFLEPMLSAQDWCMCDALRACEKRMLDDDVPAAAYHGQRGYETGYAAALAAAREAVASMEIAVAGNSAATVDQALAVIESLRKGSND